MMTIIHFESFAPGMKARLHPTCRRAYKDHRLPAGADILGRIALGTRQAFMPFTTLRRAF